MMRFAAFYGLALLFPVVLGANCHGGSCTDLTDESSLLQVVSDLQTRRPALLQEDHTALFNKTDMGSDPTCGKVVCKDDECECEKGKLYVHLEYKSKVGEVGTKVGKSNLEKMCKGKGKAVDTWPTEEKYQKMIQDGTELHLERVDTQGQGGCTKMVAQVIQLAEKQLKTRFDTLSLLFDAEPASKGCACYQHAAHDLGWKKLAVAYKSQSHGTDTSKFQGKEHPGKYGFGMNCDDKNKKPVPGHFPDVSAKKGGVCNYWIFYDREDKDKVDHTKDAVDEKEDIKEKVADPPKGGKADKEKDMKHFNNVMNVGTQWSLDSRP